MFNDIKMGTKLTGSFMVIVAILIMVATVGYINIKSIAERGNAIFTQNTAAIEDMSAINASLETMRADIYRYLDVPGDRQKMSRSIDDSINFVNKTMQTYKSRSNGAEEKKIIAEFDAAWPEMQRAYKEGMKAKDEGRDDEVASLLGAGSYGVQARIKTFAAIHELNEINRKNAEAANKANIDAASKASVTMLVAAIFSVALAAALGLILTTSITGPLKKAVWMMGEMTKGHIAERLGIERKDEIGILAAIYGQVCRQSAEHDCGRIK